MIIHLISGPRNVSTALMYAFAQREDTIVMDEPFYGFYLQYTDIMHPGRESIIASMENEPRQIFNNIAAQEKKKGNVFIKNMAHHLQGFDYTAIKSYENVFLIRDPAQMLASYAKVREQPVLQDIGLKQQASLFSWLQAIGRPPVVINGNELRADPKSILSQLCQRLQFSFTNNMLQWPSGPKPEDGIWAQYWYTNVHTSTGFSPPDTQTPSLPDQLLPVYKAALPYYDFLNTYALKA